MGRRVRGDGGGGGGIKGPIQPIIVPLLRVVLVAGWRCCFAFEVFPLFFLFLFGTGC